MKILYAFLPAFVYLIPISILFISLKRDAKDWVFSLGMIIALVTNLFAISFYVFRVFHGDHVAAVACSLHGILFGFNFQTLLRHLRGVRQEKKDALERIKRQNEW